MQCVPFCEIVRRPLIPLVYPSLPLLSTHNSRDKSIPRVRKSPDVRLRAHISRRRRRRRRCSVFRKHRKGTHRATSTAAHPRVALTLRQAVRDRSRRDDNVIAPNRYSSVALSCCFGRARSRRATRRDDFSDGGEPRSVRRAREVTVVATGASTDERRLVGFSSEIAAHVLPSFLIAANVSDVSATRELLEIRSSSPFDDFGPMIFPTIFSPSRRSRPSPMGDRTGGTGKARAGLITRARGATSRRGRDVSWLAGWLAGPPAGSGRALV